MDMHQRGGEIHNSLHNFKLPFNTMSRLEACHKIVGRDLMHSHAMGYSILS